jgi:hypothetical protein
MFETNEEYVVGHRNSIRCEIRFCARCLSAQNFRAIEKDSIDFTCEACGAAQRLLDISESHIPAKATPSRRFAPYRR